MPRIDAVVECTLHDSFRVRQIAGMFDLPLDLPTRESFQVEIPAIGDDWQIGAIVGPSGSGKSTVARAAFAEAVHHRAAWPKDQAVIDAFGEHSIRHITKLLTAVGFSSPPCWLRPFHVLSGGEQFRCELARALLTPGELTVFDEFTSVVDRTAAKIGSAAVSKAIRSGRVKKNLSPLPVITMCFPGSNPIGISTWPKVACTGGVFGEATYSSNCFVAKNLCGDCLNVITI